MKTIVTIGIVSGIGGVLLLGILILFVVAFVILKKKEVDITDADSVTSSLVMETPPQIKTRKVPVQPVFTDIEESLGAPNDEGIDQGLGKVSFSLNYIKENKSLKVNVMRAEHLPPIQNNGSCDAFVKVSFIPDLHGTKMCTKTAFQTLSPLWNEDLVFNNFPEHLLEDRSLVLTVMSKGDERDNLIIGKVLFPLVHLQCGEPNEVLKCSKYLRLSKDGRGYVGEIEISLCYIPEKSDLTLNVLKARLADLPNIKKKFNVFCEIKFIDHEGKIVRVKKSPATPAADKLATWNYSAGFKVDPSNLYKSSIVIQVFNKEHGGLTTTKVGHVILKARGGHGGAKHWCRMLSEPRIMLQQWHSLLP